MIKMLKDTALAGGAALLDAQIDTWLVAGKDAPRGASADELGDLLLRVGVRGKVLRFADTEHALAHACNEAGENDRIAAFGSFYTVAAVLAQRG
jgi:dihydrofolate synthase/folylpolyglutamate synthase